MQPAAPTEAAAPIASLPLTSMSRVGRFRDKAPRYKNWLVSQKCHVT